MKMRWLGINGFAFDCDGRTVLIDPYVSRDKERLCHPHIVRKYIPKADAILLGHSHWDHMADVAEIASYTDTVIFGSETALNICRSLGIAEHRLVRWQRGVEVDLGGLRVKALRSAHKAPVGYPGEYASVPREVTQAPHYLEGGTWAIHLRSEAVSILNIGSADFIPDEVRGIACDCLLVSIAGRAPGFLRGVLSCVKAGVLIPTHFDDFFHRPVEDAGERVSLQQFRAEMQEVAPRQSVRVLDVLQQVDLPMK